MEAMNPLLRALLAALCLALPAWGADPPPRSIPLEGHGILERSELRQAPAGQGRWQGFPISVSLHKAPLPEVVRAFAKLAGFNLVLDPRVQGEVTVELKDVPWDLALHMILRTHGMAAEVNGRLWRVAPR